MSVTLRSTTGKPASTPEPSTDSRPFSTPGMYSFGTVPPTTSFSNSKPLAGGKGSATILTRANWPEPAGLLLVDTIEGHRLANLLAISNLGGAYIGLDFVGSFQDVDLDVEMKLPHSL